MFPDLKLTSFISVFMDYTNFNFKTLIFISKHPNAKHTPVENISEGIPIGSQSHRVTLLLYMVLVLRGLRVIFAGAKQALVESGSSSYSSCAISGKCAQLHLIDYRLVKLATKTV